MEKYQIYDQLVSLTLTELRKNINEHNNMIEIQVDKKFFKNKNLLYYYELAKMAQTFYDTEIVVDCNFINYIKFLKIFKIKKYKTKIRRINKENKTNNININLFLLKIISDFNENNKNRNIHLDSIYIFSEIYDAYYNPKNFKVVK